MALYSDQGKGACNCRYGNGHAGNVRSVEKEQCRLQASFTGEGITLDMRMLAFTLWPD
jgi:hypothetical protein